ncbi:hypothetical protein LZ30DRAFT_741291 [Colletotrichum cereale]|nr:hypothetical protein LZ30DRAFT_741291 [Colletotrichum cereale]
MLIPFGPSRSSMKICPATISNHPSISLTRLHSPPPRLTTERIVSKHNNYIDATFFCFQIYQPLQTMSLDPFDDVLTLEDQFFAEGYRQGTEDGIQAGKIEGRSVGLAKGYEKFLESGRIHGRSVVWANRLSLPQKGSATASLSNSSSRPPRNPAEASQRQGACSLPPLAANARLEKNVAAVFALVEPDTLARENSDEAVNDFDDRLKRAQGKVKIIERMTGEAVADSKGAEAKEM